jgi:hypothetical protein
MNRLQRCLHVFALCMALTTPVLAAEPRSLVIENSGLSGKELLAALTSTSFSEKRHAEMYLLGVLDATELIAWCDYKTVKTSTLREAVHTGLKSLSQAELEKRASTLISGILHQRFPCWGKQ